ncbi:hypothetical protein GN956_G2615 [Arapaima gigas]
MGNVEILLRRPLTYTANKFLSGCMNSCISSSSYERQQLSIHHETLPHHSTQSFPKESKSSIYCRTNRRNMR